MLDPTNRNTVYAGTTEGLYKTLDGGTTWKRMTGPDVIVNDVFRGPQESAARTVGDRSQRGAGERRLGGHF